VVKSGRCVRLTTLPPPCAIVMKSENLNFLEPSGPLQSCNGTALPLPNAEHIQTLPRYNRGCCKKILPKLERIAKYKDPAIRTNDNYK